MYSGIHNLSWSSRYLKSEVFMSELKLVGVYDVGAADAAGNSALHYAAAGGASFQTLTALVQAGTNPYQLNTAGQLFLHCLQPQFVDFFPTPYDKDQVSRFQEDLVNLFHTFHSKGAFRWRDNEGRTPMDALKLHIGDSAVSSSIFRRVKQHV
jgi:ankyrin repeat protein